MIHRATLSLDIMTILAAILVLIFLLPETATAQRKQPILIPLGSYLHPTSEPTAWYSPSRRFAFGFFPEGMGFRVGIWLVNGPNNNTVVWCANRDNPGVPSDATLEFVDGKFLLKTGQSQEKIIDAESAHSACMLDSGNFVLYNQDNVIIWESFSAPTDTILGGQNLLAGRKLIPGITSTNHSSGCFRLEMQTDGNLVAYATCPMNIAQTVDAYWASDTWRNGKSHLVLYTNGSMLLISDSSSLVNRELHISSVPNNDTIYQTTFDYDGNFRLYSHSFNSDGSSSMKIEWEALENECDIKGFCGLNSYCVRRDNAPYCICLPGSTFIHKDQNFGGCESDFTQRKCIAGKEDAAVFRIIAAKNLTWDDHPYFVTSILGKEDCSKSCSEDCECDAALYDVSGRCAKHKLPLKYVKSSEELSNTAFFKVSNAIARSIEKDCVKPPWLLILVISLGFVAYYGVAVAFSSFFIFKFRILQTFTGVRGTRGYLAPEWKTNAPISVKVDIYSYGIVLLEIICCRRNIEVDVSELEEIQLCVWAYKCLVKMELDKLVKGEEVDKNALQRMVAVAIWCIQDEPALRPSMKRVLQMLEGLKEVPIPPCPSACNS
nr:G-type lectin S-receptor-like serine/threonine-protein kinase LECRK2 [Ipomoea batatas]